MKQNSLLYESEAALQRRFGTRLTFVSELHRHPESFNILDSESGQVLYSEGNARQTP